MARIDLHDATYIDVAGLVVAAAVAESALIGGRDVEFIAPQRADVAGYAARMNLHGCLADIGVEVVQPSVVKRDRADLLELSRFDPTDRVFLADRVFEAMRDRGERLRECQSMFKSLSEVLDNVIEHSGAEGGWVAMHAKPTNGTVDFAVADVGVGLRRSLLQTHEVRDDTHAIELAFEKDVSGTGEVGRGQGLHSLLGRVRDRAGILRVRTGEARGVGPRRPLPIRAEAVNVQYPGTIVYASFKVGADE